jgi:hypothetical protein
LTAEGAGLVHAGNREATAGPWARRVSGIVLGAFTVAGFAIALALLYPGQYPFDSAYQFWQARSGTFSNITPVAMIWVWSLLLKVFGNPASLLCLNLAMFWTGLGLCFHVLRAPQWLKIVGILLVGLNPLALVQMAHLLSDAHMTAVMFLGMGLIAQNLRTGSRAMLVAACMLFIYAGMIRQNALAAIIPLGALALYAFRSREHIAKRAIVLSMLVAGGLTAMAATTFDRTIATERHTVWPILALWDLAAISVATDQLLLPPFTHGERLSVEELRETGAFNPISTTYLFSHSTSGIRDGFDSAYSTDQQWKLAMAWGRAVGQHPLAYLAHRARTASLLFGRQSRVPVGMPYFQGRWSFADNPPLPEPWLASAQQQLYRLADRLTSTWLFSALPFVLVELIALMLAWRRRPDPHAALAIGIASSALVYAASFLVLAPSAELRYLTWPIMAAVPAIALALSARAGQATNPGPAWP